MPVTLTIKQVPDDIAEALRALATRNHRWLQGELMAIIESVAAIPDRGKSTDDVQRRLMAPPSGSDRPATSPPLCSRGDDRQPA